MSAFAKIDDLADCHVPLPMASADSGETANSPPSNARIDRGTKESNVPHQPSWPVAQGDDLPDTERPIERYLQDELLDEAADIDIHPDELQSDRFIEAHHKVTELARKALHQSPYKELHRLSVRVSGDRVAILGQTSSFFMKQMAQEIIRRATPDLAVDNLIGVRHAPHHSYAVK